MRLTPSSRHAECACSTVPCAELRQASRSHLTRIGERLISTLEEMSTTGIGRPGRPVGNHFRCWRLTGGAAAPPVVLTLTQSRHLLALDQPAHRSGCRYSSIALEG